ncbi:MAG: hypothetical protein HY561_02440 [Gemmatimonadetes bacterium]|nr:hypothetical protein [Gemmatimonadota bacterium]
MKSRSVWKVLLIALLVACCDDAVDPSAEGVPESDMSFVQFDVQLLPLAQKEGSFWAVKGQNRELVLRYVPEKAGDPGEEFLEFEVSGNSLLRRPDGTAFATGDSILITVRVDDAGRFLFTFEPAGLQFDPDHPAELEVTYRLADPDLDGDGDDDSEDGEEERRLAIWRQGRAGERWFRLATVQFEDLDEAEADIVGFSRFALASN